MTVHLFREGRRDRGGVGQDRDRRGTGAKAPTSRAKSSLPMNDIRGRCRLIDITRSVKYWEVAGAQAPIRLAAHHLAVRASDIDGPAAGAAFDLVLQRRCVGRFSDMDDRPPSD